MIYLITLIQNNYLLKKLYKLTSFTQAKSVSFQKKKENTKKTRIFTCHWVSKYVILIFFSLYKIKQSFNQQRRCLYSKSFVRIPVNTTIK